MGRRPDPEKKLATISVRIPPEWIPEVDAAAKKRGISRSEFAAKALRRVLDGEDEKPLPVRDAAGRTAVNRAENFGSRLKGSKK